MFNLRQHLSLVGSSPWFEAGLSTLGDLLSQEAQEAQRREGNIWEQTIDEVDDRIQRAKSDPRGTREEEHNFGNHHPRAVLDAKWLAWWMQRHGGRATRAQMMKFLGQKKDPLIPRQLPKRLREALMVLDDYDLIFWYRNACELKSKPQSVAIAGR